MAVVNEFHWEIIATYMENHPDIAVGRAIGPNAKLKAKTSWQQLAEQLNSLGYGEKSADKWQKTWTDYKYHLKRRASEIKQDQLKTGGGPGVAKSLSRLDQRILQILGNSFYEGIGTKEAGFGNLSGNAVLVDTNDGKSNVPSPSTSYEVNNEDENTIMINVDKKRMLQDHDGYLKKKG